MKANNSDNKNSLEVMIFSGEFFFFLINFSLTLKNYNKKSGICVIIILLKIFYTWHKVNASHFVFLIIS